MLRWAWRLFVMAEPFHKHIALMLTEEEAIQTRDALLADLEYWTTSVMRGVAEKIIAGLEFYHSKQKEPE